MPSEKSEEVTVQPAEYFNKQARPLAGKADVDVDIEKEIETAVNATPEEHAHDQDEAMKAVHEMNGELVEVDEQTNKRLLRTIDRHLMPIMCVVYAMNFLDSMFSPNDKANGP